LTDFDIWLTTDVVQRGTSLSEMTDLGCHWFLARKLVSPPEQTVERIIRSARQRVLDGYLTAVAAQLSVPSAAELEASLADPRAAPDFND